MSSKKQKKVAARAKAKAKKARNLANRKNREAAATAIVEVPKVVIIKEPRTAEQIDILVQEFESAIQSGLDQVQLHGNLEQAEAFRLVALKNQRIVMQETCSLKRIPNTEIAYLLEVINDARSIIAQAEQEKRLVRDAKLKAKQTADEQARAVQQAAIKEARAVKRGKWLARNAELDAQFAASRKARKQIRRKKEARVLISEFAHLRATSPDEQYSINRCNEIIEELRPLNVSAVRIGMKRQMAGIKPLVTKVSKPDTRKDFYWRVKKDGTSVLCKTRKKRLPPTNKLTRKAG